MSHEAIRESYAARAGRFGAERDRWARRSNRVSLARLAAFLVLAAALFRLGWPGLDGGRPALILAAAAAAAFVALVAYHDRVESRVRWFDLLHAVNQEAGVRYDRHWDALPLPDFSPVDPKHPYAADLGVTGRASLLHLLGGAATRAGRDALAGWLLAPAGPATAAARAEAVAELAPLEDLRDELQVRGRRLGEASPARFTRFLEWTESEPWFARSRLRVAAARIVPAATVTLGVLQAAGAVAGAWWLIPVLAGWIATGRWGKRAAASLDSSDPARDLFAHYRDLFRLIHAAPGRSPLLAQLHGELAGARPAHEAIDRLRRIVEAGNVRHSTLGHFFAQTFLLWDFQVLTALERWQRRSGRQARRWFAALAEYEALAVLAILRHDHPDWAAATLDPTADRLSAVGLGHPLLAPGLVVRNDVEVGPAGRFQLVTGSNMSGKSTLVRAIGLNAVLAQAGGPVCADDLRMPPLRIQSAIHVEDSLAEGVSYFMAELRRLKQVVDAAEDPAGPRVLYLLDEILQGTNSAERQVAARHVIARLLATGAIGAVTTHDLALAETPELAAAAVPVHFRETITERDGHRGMTFDYRLRPGVATSVNALRLLEMVGL